MIPVHWRAREEPLVPEWAVATGACVEALRAAVPDGAEIVEGPELLLVRADPPPWVDGVRYLGRDPEAPGALWPTDRHPVPHPALVLAAARRAHPEVDGPLAIWPGALASLASPARVTVP